MASQIGDPLSVNDPTDICDHSVFGLPTLFEKLQEIQDLGDEKFSLFRSDPLHPSLGFAKKGAVWTVDIGLHFTAIAWREGNNLVWFWIGSHEDYNRLMNRVR